MSYLRQSGIYCIRHADSGRMYIGSAVDLSGRLRSHRNSLKSGRHHSPRLQHAWDRYGSEAFEFVVVEFVDHREQLVAREQVWIDFFRAAEQGRGFNICRVAGSTLGRVRSDAERAAMSLRAKEQWATPEARAFRSKVARQYYALPENREYHSRKAKDRFTSQEARDKASAGAHRRFQSETPEQRTARSDAQKGKTHSDAAREKMRQSQLKRQERDRVAGTVYRHSDESLAKQSAIHKELHARERAAGIVRKHSPETLAKIGAANKIAQQDPAVRAKAAATRLARKGV